MCVFHTLSQDIPSIHVCTLCYTVLYCSAFVLGIVCSSVLCNQMTVYDRYLSCPNFTLLCLTDISILNVGATYLIPQWDDSYNNLIPQLTGQLFRRRQNSCSDMCQLGYQHFRKEELTGSSPNFWLNTHKFWPYLRLMA